MSDAFCASSCKICFDAYDGETKKPELMVPCGHTFCKDCLWKLATPECPTCKMPYRMTVTVWDLIPSTTCTRSQSEVKEAAGSLESELGAFQTILEHVQELHKKEADLNEMHINQARSLINSKAQEVIDRVRDEQSALLHRLQIHENLLEKRKIRNGMIESFAKQQYELVSMQTKYNSSSQAMEESSDHDLVKEIRQEMAQLGHLKEDIESFIKTAKPIFFAKGQSTPEHLLGKVGPYDDAELAKSSIGEPQLTCSDQPSQGLPANSRQPSGQRAGSTVMRFYLEPGSLPLQASSQSDTLAPVFNAQPAGHSIWPQ